MRLNRSTTEIKVKLLPDIENDGETVKLMKVNPVGIIINPIPATDWAEGTSQPHTLSLESPFSYFY